MPAVQSGLILVTGASGFIATHTIGRLLDAGYRVRAVVRSREKGDYINSLYPGKEDKIEHAVVKDMVADGAYDEAVKGVDAILHLASPLDLWNEGHPDLVIQPAVKGVLGILNSAAAHGQNVKRIVQVSSVASVYTPGATTKKVYDENATVEKEGINAPAAVKYLASKTIAERKFWNWLETNNHSFDAVSLLPGMVFGPPTAFTATENEVIGSLTFAIPYLKPGVGEDKLKEVLINLVDVRDVADALVSALQKPEAAGERILLVSSTLVGNDIAVAGARAFPDAGLDVRTDAAFSNALNDGATVLDGSKATRILSLKYISKEKTLEDTVKEVYPKVNAKA